MKKLILMMAMAAVCAASCNKMDKATASDDMSQVTFSVDVPQEILSKGISDGESAKELTYAVYRNGAHLSHLDAASVQMVGKKAEVTINLVKNVEYVVVFWAKTPGTDYYTFDKTNAQISVNYAVGKANDDARDAFYKAEKVTITSNSQDVDVYLRRPFAQINFWALETAYNEVTSLGFTAMTSDFKVTTKVPAVLNVLDGTVDEEATIAFDADAIPHLSDQTKFTYDGKSYVRVGMNYVLASADDAANTVLTLASKFYYNDDDVEVPVSDVSYKRNYRTNILGNFFTGDANFKVIILPDYDNDGDGVADEFIKTI